MLSCITVYICNGPQPQTLSFGFTQHSQQSVTVVLFQDEQTLISSGAVDG